MSDKSKKNFPLRLATGEGKGERPRYDVKTPVGYFNGERFGVPIRDGKGATFDESEARRCLAAGYEVTVDGKPLE
jgi:hypothetical protein